MNTFLPVYLKYKKFIDGKINKTNIRNKELKEDLRQQCIIELMEAIKKFDFDYQTKYDEEQNKWKGIEIFINNRLNWVFLSWFYLP